MEVEKLKLELSKNPGIYRFVNSINGKSYVGQAVSLRVRFKAHIANYKQNRYDTPLYRAINKYGFENFEYYIEESIEETLEKEALKNKLDELEKYYIQKYDSYNHGYNQTLGGDYGVLGYKMTPKQLEKIRTGANKVHEDGRNTVYIYDSVNDSIQSFPTMRILADSLGLNFKSIGNAYRNETYYLRRYLLARSEDQLQKRINTLKNSNNYLEHYYKYMCDRFYLGKTMNQKIIAQELNVTKDTLCKRNQKLKTLGFDIIWEKSPKIHSIQVVDEINKLTYESSISELSKKFNISEKQVRNTIRRSEEQKTPYRKQYRFKIIYEI